MANALERRFELAQTQLKRSEAARQRDEERALRRQFAQAGALGSGAAIKTGLEQRALGAERLQSGMLGLETEKLGQQYQEEQAGIQRKFITSERLGSQEYGTREREAAQKYGTSERLGAQDFTAEQARLGREFQTLERLGAQEFASIESKLARNQEWKKFTRTLDFEKTQAEIANKLAQSEFDINKFVTLENLNMARRSMGLDPLSGFTEIPSERAGKLPLKWRVSKDDAIKAIKSGGNAWDRRTNQRIVGNTTVTEEEWKQLKDLYGR